MIENLCMPALIYLIYGTTHVIIDAYKGNYNLAFMQIWITMLFTLILNILCRNGLSAVSWIFVSLPFILMTVIAGVLLFVFGLNPTTGQKIYESKSETVRLSYASPVLASFGF